MLFDLKNDMEEIWKTVKGYNGYYQVSNTGKVRNPNKVLTPNVGVKNGYVYVTLRKDKRLLHRIVAETFIPNPFNKPEVDHINGIRTDNRLENLRWASGEENTLFMMQNRAELNKELTRIINKIGYEKTLETLRSL